MIEALKKTLLQESSAAKLASDSRVVRASLWRTCFNCFRGYKPIIYTPVLLKLILSGRSDRSCE